jgi:hypothetical protein
MKPSAIDTMLRHLKGFVKAAQELIKELESGKNNIVVEGVIFKKDTDLKDLPEGKLVDKDLIKQ